MPAKARLQEEQVELALPFSGGHVLEFYELTPAVRTQQLEAWLERSSDLLVPPTLK